MTVVGYSRAKNTKNYPGSCQQVCENEAWHFKMIWSLAEGVDELILLYQTRDAGSYITWQHYQPIQYQ